MVVQLDFKYDSSHLQRLTCKSTFTSNLKKDERKMMYCKSFLVKLYIQYCRNLKLAIYPLLFCWSKLFSQLSVKVPLEVLRESEDSSVTSGNGTSSSKISFDFDFEDGTSPLTVLSFLLLSDRGTFGSFFLEWTKFLNEKGLSLSFSSILFPSAILKLYHWPCIL